MGNSQEQEKRVASSRTRIALKLPFFAVFLVRMNVTETTDPKRVKTMATNGKNIWWNADFVRSITDAQIDGVLVHEVLHIICKHHLRVEKRDHKKWNRACDYVIDPIVMDTGLKIPSGPGFEHHLDRTWTGKTAEYVYARLPDKDENGNPYPSGMGDVIQAENEDGKALSETEAKLEEANINQMITVAEQAQKNIGKLPGGLQQIIREARESQVPFEDILERFIGGDKPEGHNFSRPARHQWHNSRLFMPAQQKTGVGHIVVAIDTSNSMSDEELRMAFGETKTLIEDFMPESVTIIYADSGVQRVEVFEKGEEIDRLNIKGKGGTRVQPAITWAENLKHPVNRFIYITDMGFNDATEPPSFPILWVASQAGAPPYGDICRIRI